MGVPTSRITLKLQHKLHKKNIHDIPRLAQSFHFLKQSIKMNNSSFEKKIHWIELYDIVDFYKNVHMEKLSKNLATQIARLL